MTAVYSCVHVSLYVCLPVSVCISLFGCIFVSLFVCVCDSGNLESLKHCPQSRNIDIYKTLQQFRLKYYLPQYMTLAVQSQGLYSLLTLLLLPHLPYIWPL